jgi:ABC-type enterochelin transport system permease subunit
MRIATLTKEVGENQKDSFKLCGQALSLCAIVVVVVVVVIVPFVGLFIPSIKLKDKGGWLVERRNQWENIFTFL